MTEGELRPFVDDFEIPDPALTQKIVTHIKAQGIFDQFRRDCMADVDTKPAYQNLRQRVETSVRTFLTKNPWKPEMNKNQMRELLRKHLQSGTFLENGMDRIVDQVVNPRVYSVFLPKVEDVVRNCLKMDENNKPIFVPPPKPDLRLEAQRRSITSRARVPAPLIGPRMHLSSDLEAVKDTLGKDDDDSMTGYKVASSDLDDSSQNNFVVDQNNAKPSLRVDDDDDDDDDEDDEDEEESPPFEPHSEDDPQILGVRTDSDSDDGLVVTIVDDNLEETIEQNNVAKEARDLLKDEANENHESSEESEESSSDEYVPKTPTINMESPDGTMIECQSITEYKQYQTKFDGESFENVEEEIVSTNWVDELSEVKEDQSSNEENSVGESRKRKFNEDSLDEASSSSNDKGSTSDEGKPIFDSNNLKLFKMHKDDTEFDSINEFYNEEYNSSSSPDKSPRASSLKQKSSDSESTSKSKHSISSKDSDESHRHYHSHRDTKDDNSHEPQSSSTQGKEHGEKTDDKQDPSKHRHSKKHESSSSKHNERHRSSHERNSKERTTDKKLEVDSRDKNHSNGGKRESHHEHKEKHSDNHDRNSKEHDRYEKHIDGKKEIESSYRHDKDKKDSSNKSKHSHGSSRHHHKSSSDKYKSDTDSKHRDSSSSKHSSHSKNKDKEDKHKSKQKYREHCKSSDKNGEGRRSSDRDSSGPSSRSTSSSHSRQSSGRPKTETPAESSDKMSSNSDNAVSEPLETMQADSASSTFEGELVASTKQVTNVDESQVSNSEQNNVSNEDYHGSSFDYSDNENNNKKSELGFPSSMEEVETTAIEINVAAKDSLDEGNTVYKHTESVQNQDTYEEVDNESDSCNPHNLGRDSSSEKENIEQAINYSIETEDNKVIKFKKPKIAANIFEVKKIMQARRNIKRLETIQLSKSISENDEVRNSSNDEGESFKGFMNTVSNKREQYESLIERLSNEIENLSKTPVPNVVTPWMEFDQKYDDYITNTLKGKVHRKARVCIPSVCEEFYDYDEVHKLYILRDNNDLKFVTKDSIEETSGQYCQTSNFNACSSETKEPTLNETSDAGSALLHDDSVEDTCLLSNTPDNKLDQTQADLSSITSDMSSTSQWSLSYNTYEDYIKNKEIDNVPQAKRPTPPRTVVKITNSESSEQVSIVKDEESDLKKNRSIPRITRMDTKLNGKIPRATNEPKQIPLISRIKKVKVDKTEANKTQSLNGVTSPDSTTNSEEESPIEMSTQMISEVIGIQSETINPGKTRVQRCLKERQTIQEQKSIRSNKQIVIRQRYENSDLYKPRLQLASRRLKTQTVTDTVSPKEIVYGRKRTHSLEKKTTPIKRRR